MTSLLLYNTLMEPPQPTYPFNAQPQPEPASNAFPTIEWTASEYVLHKKGGSWYMILGAGAAVVIIVVFAITRNLFSALVIALAFLCLGVFAAKEPSVKSYQITADGVLIDNRFMPFMLYKSFSLMEEGAVRSIWLRPLRKYAPTTVMFFAADDEARILDMLENFLPEENRQLDVIDKLVRHIRF